MKHRTPLGEARNYRASWWVLTQKQLIDVKPSNHACRLALSPKGMTWAAVIVMLALSGLSLLNLATLEFGPWRDEAIAIDELYFSACAVRGLATGYIPSTGCQDNKAPLIFLVHQFVQAGNAPYSIIGIKIAAFIVVAVQIILTAWIARRQASNFAALAVAALALQVLTSDAGLLALKTEAVGNVFMLLGVLVVTWAPQPSYLRWLVCGLLLGMAMMSKQTFAFATAMILVWLWIRDGMRAPHGWSERINSTLAFCLGSAIPLLAFLAVFYAQDHHRDYLTSTFLYPAAYAGPATGAGVAKTLVWRAATVLSDLASAPLVFALFCVGLVLLAKRGTVENIDRRLALLAAMATGMLALALIAPIYFQYHLIPAWLLMAAVGGITLHSLTIERTSSSGEPVIGIAVFLLVLSLMTAAKGWLDNGKRGRDVELANSRTLLSEHKGAYAYSLVGDPSFYVYNGLVPASDVGFSWALPGSRASWYYTPPKPDTWQERALRSVQDRNARRLIEDFAKTPPRFFVLPAAPESGQVSTGIALLDAYVAQHCHYIQAIKTRAREPGHLYTCNPSPPLGLPEAFREKGDRLR